MRYAPLRSRKSNGPAPAGRPAAHTKFTASDPMGQTLGDKLKAAVGSDYNELWLAQALGCSPATANELQGYLVPNGPPHLLEQTLGVFAKVLDLDAQRLSNLVNGASQPSRGTATVPVRRNIPPRQPRPETRPENRVSTAPQRPSAPPPSPPQAEISIGSAEGVRVVKQQQPTIVYRKTRRYAGQA